MYGDNALGVEEGQLWRVGPHWFLCGDVIEHSRKGNLAFMPDVDVMFTDPPWTPALYSRFYHAAGREPEDDLPKFLRDLVSLTLSARTCIFDIGIDAYPTLLEAIAAAHGDVIGQARTTYGPSTAPRPSRLVIAARGRRHPIHVPEGMHGPRVVSWVMRAFLTRPSVYFDPCCGKLVFVTEAIKLGATCFGCELIPEKLSLGMETLGRFLREQPMLIQEVS